MHPVQPVADRLARLAEGDALDRRRALHHPVAPRVEVVALQYLQAQTDRVRR